LNALSAHISPTQLPIVDATASTSPTSCSVAPNFHRLLHVELETRFAEESVLPVSALPMVAQQSPLEREETVSHRGRFGKREARRPGQFGTLPADESDAGAWDVATGSLGDRAGTPDHTHALRIPSVNAAAGRDRALKVATTYGAPSRDARRVSHQAGDRQGVDRTHCRNAMPREVDMDARIAGAKRIAANPALINDQRIQRDQFLYCRVGSEISRGWCALQSPVRKHLGISRAQDGVGLVHGLLQRECISQLLHGAQHGWQVTPSWKYSRTVVPRSLRRSKSLPPTPRN